MIDGLRPLTISLHALGGQGGGVLADWIVEVATRAGWLAQHTSIPGVAQRTGSTVYYVELFPPVRVEDPQPVLALAPSPGDVDLLIAAELIEAGRALNRNLISRRTTLVVSSGRVYTVAEKSNMGDGRVSNESVLEALRSAAGRTIVFDMQAEAARTTSVISAVLLGAVCASEILPFPPEAYEAAIKASGIAVQTNLAGFMAGRTAATSETSALQPRPRLHTAEALIAEGVRRLTDYQDVGYADLYQQRLARFRAFERHQGSLMTTLARYLALWMSYEDTVRVADLKIRATRFDRVRTEVGVQPGQILHVTEYLHPRIEEICDMLPARCGRLVLQTRWLRSLAERFFARGRHVVTSKLGGFLLLYLIASLRSWRRSTLRYQRENARIEAWLERVAAEVHVSYERAVEIARCQRLIKGYGDTYDRGWSRFQILMGISASVDAATLGALREAALADEEGRALERALRELRCG
jgi:indolepyruvate ferredoxin oxidoreductase beta subunit